MKIFILVLVFIGHAYSECAFSPQGVEYRLEFNKIWARPHHPNLFGQLEYCGGVGVPRCNNTRWVEIYKTETRRCDEYGCSIIVFEKLYREYDENIEADSEYESCMIYSMDHILSEAKDNELHAVYISIGVGGGAIILCFLICACAFVYKLYSLKNKQYHLPEGYTVI